MSKATESVNFETLNACHAQIHGHLNGLAALARRVEAEGVDAAVQQQAGEIEAFFSSTSRQHHVDEEKIVFPPLLAGGDAALATAVRTLQQDHGWIEENWLELAPQLRAMASGNNWIYEAEFQHDVEVFLALCRDHIAREEALVYPEFKALQAREVGSGG